MLLKFVCIFTSIEIFFLETQIDFFYHQLLLIKKIFGFLVLLDFPHNYIVNIISELCFCQNKQIVFLCEYYKDKESYYLDTKFWNHVLEFNKICFK